MSNIQEFDYSVDILQSILWQYDGAIRLKALLEAKSAWWFNNQSLYWNDWFTDVFDLYTANAFGLAVWSVILDLPLFIPDNVDPPGKPIFGFNQYDPTFPTLLNTYLNFGNSNFSVLGSSVTLTLEEQRIILKLRYFQLISRGSIEGFILDQPENPVSFLLGINDILAKVFNPTTPAPYNGSAWVLDGLDMTMTYVFNFYLPPQMREIFVAYDLLPRPAGVELKYLVLPSVNTFGFNAYDPSFPDLLNTNQNFGNGNFYPSSFI